MVFVSFLFAVAPLLVRRFLVLELFSEWYAGVPGCVFLPLKAAPLMHSSIIRFKGSWAPGGGGGY